MKKKCYLTKQCAYFVQVANYVVWFTFVGIYTTRNCHHQVKKTLTIPVKSKKNAIWLDSVRISYYEGVGQPFSPMTLLHTHLPFGRGTTQGTYRRELIAERLLPLMLYMGLMWVPLSSVSFCHLGDTAQSRMHADGITRPSLPATSNHQTRATQIHHSL